MYNKIICKNRKFKIYLVENNAFLFDISKCIFNFLCKFSYIKDFLYKLTNRKHLLKKYKPIFKEHKRNPNMVFLVYTPTHENLGDHAIALAEMTLLEDMDIPYTEITTPEIHKLKEFGLLGLFNNTKILKEHYFIQNLYLALYMIIFCGSKIYILTVLMTLFIIIIYKIINNRKTENLPIAFYLCISNILIIAMSYIIINYML